MENLKRILSVIGAERLELSMTPLLQRKGHPEDVTQEELDEFAKDFANRVKGLLKPGGGPILVHSLALLEEYNSVKGMQPLIDHFRHVVKECLGRECWVRHGRQIVSANNDVNFISNPGGESLVARTNMLVPLVFGEGALFKLMEAEDLPVCFTRIYGLEEEGDSVYGIFERRNIRTLHEILCDGDFSVEAIVEWFLEYLRGAKYLEEKGLVLLDIFLRNLGVDQDTGRAVYFDLETVVPVGVAKSFWVNPEVYAPFSSVSGYVVRSEEMTYQLGDALKKMLNDVDEEAERFFSPLLEKMISDNPDEIIGLGEAIERLEELRDLRQSLQRPSLGERILRVLGRWGL